MKILTGLTLLLIYQLIGEVLVLMLDLPIPGPVIGMLLLLVSLLSYGGLLDKVSDGADALLGHLSLLFVPAGVGVMVHFHLLAEQGISIVITLLASTLLTLALTALLLQWLRRGSADRSGHCD